MPEVVIDIREMPYGRCVLRATWPEQLPEDQEKFTYVGPVSCTVALMRALGNEVQRHFGLPHHNFTYGAINSGGPVRALWECQNAEQDPRIA